MEAETPCHVGVTQIQLTTNKLMAAMYLELHQRVHGRGDFLSAAQIRELDDNLTNYRSH
jgi:hypothetical protein